MIQARFITLYLLCVSFACAGPAAAYAQNAEKIVDAGKRIMDARDNVALYEAFESAKALYAAENKYSEFVEFLSSLARKKKPLEAYVNYYSALARYSQLRHLEDNQLWDDYFKNGNRYRDEVAGGAAAAVKGTPGTDPVHVYAQLLVWQFHKDQQDSQSDETLMSLMKSAEAYVKGNGTVMPIKDAADKLMSYGERARARDLYKIYVGKVITTTTANEEIKTIAAGFHRDGNNDLAESVYDVYFTRLGNGPKDTLISELKQIAPQFAYAAGGSADAGYAEKLFQRLEYLAGMDAFDAPLLYLRAYNAQMARDMGTARDYYRSLTKRFPQSPHADEAAYKAALMTVYSLKDADGGTAMLKALAEKDGAVSAQVVSAVYQLGVLSQWQRDTAAAKEFYTQAVAKAGEEFSETADLARERLKEIDADQDMEGNLKKFMETAFGRSSRPVGADIGIMELNCAPAQPRRNQDVAISASASLGATGCFPVDMQYLWSGHLGSARPGSDAVSFTTSYRHPGTKEINLVVVSGTGTVDYALIFVDAQ